MNDDQLQKLVEQISLSFFGKKFVHKAYFNHRLRTTGGRYLLNNHDIEVNKKYYEQYGMDELIGIIKHELCHYHLHIEGKGFRHRDSDFKMLLKKVGAPRFCTPLREKNKNNIIYIYKCLSCMSTFIRRRKMNPERYLCGKCGGKIQFYKNNG
ncbi:SprT family protein [Aeribacillus sp. FSL K6-1121]|uniref:SprT family protein n=1 Tax=Aeribacillus sp. FSL K6-1121 TaxID=2954745 RepID=UPI0030F66423